MGRVVSFNHSHVCPAVLGELIDERTVKQTKANVGVAKAIGFEIYHRGRCDGFLHEELH
jgi:hypothetical protein